MGRAKCGAVQRYSLTFRALRSTITDDTTIAAAVHFTDPASPFTVTEEEFARDIAINTTSAYAAVKEALASFQTLPDSAAKTFFYTGNKLNTPGFLLPAALTLGVGKVATSHIIEVADKVYKEKGIK